MEGILTLVDRSQLRSQGHSTEKTFGNKGCGPDLATDGDDGLMQFFKGWYRPPNITLIWRPTETPELEKTSCLQVC